MGNKKGGVIWTNHALDRLAERGITEAEALSAFRYPDKSRYAKSKGGWVYRKNLGREIIEVVAKKNETGEWLILSVWSKPAQDIHKVKTRTDKDGIFLRILKHIFRV